MPNRLLFLFFILMSAGASAQQPEALPPVAVELDSATYSSYGYMAADSLLRINPVTDNAVFPKSLDTNFRTKYKGDEFDYTTIKPRESLWEKIQRRLEKILQPIFGEKLPQQTHGLANVVFRILAIIIVAFVLYFLISYLLSKDGNFIFGKRNKKINLNDADLKENIHEINFAESISGYETKKDFRSAVRYHYLHILKQLSDQKIIHWNPEKTNKDYVAEYTVPSSKNQFRELSYIFDYVWYGEFDINEGSYGQFKTKFEKFKV